LLTLVATPARARAAGLPDATTIVKAGAYILPVGCSTITGSYHVVYMLYEEGAPRRWRTAAYICGGVSIGLGTFILVDNGSGAGGFDTFVGVLPIVLGTGAILAAWFVGAPDDIVGPQSRMTPWFGPGSAGMAWTGTF